LEAIKEKISVLLAEKFQEEGFNDCFLVDVKVFQKPRVEVYVDCDHGVSHKMCVSISRHIEKYLDETKVLGEKYTLEVSSPGLERPLIPRQFQKNTGRSLKVKMNSGETLSGVLKEISQNGFILEITDKKEGTTLLPIGFEEIEFAKIIVSF
jgi:ribosome maturation factor RimP